MKTVWLIAGPGDLRPLERTLVERGITVRRAADPDLSTVAMEAYDARGLVVVDVRRSDRLARLKSHAQALVPILAVAPRTAILPAGVLRLDAMTAPDRMGHYVLEILAEETNLRRHPRVETSVPVSIGGKPYRTRNISLYGVLVDGATPWTVGTSLELLLGLDDGARVNLRGEVVAVREQDVALRVRPVTDEDLLLWVHLLLGELADSPLHGDLDPLGDLFV